MYSSLMSSPKQSPVAYSSLGERAQPPTIAKLMAMALETPNLLSLAAGFTDNATLPVDFVRAATEAMLANPGDHEFLQYGTNQGRPRLRQLLAERLAKIEPGLDAAELQRGLFVTNGSQQALYLAMQVLGEPGRTGPLLRAESQAGRGGVGAGRFRWRNSASYRGDPGAEAASEDGVRGRGHPPRHHS